jgi:Fe-Mn family superoxide dismutase
MFTLPNLPYDYDALEPAISKDIMQLHHDKHHQTYVDKLNTALQDHPDLQGKTVEELLTGLSTLPESIQAAVRNHGGGHYNHSLFWLWMSPTGGGEPTGALGQALIAKYGSFQAFVDAFSAKATGLFGSGWVWLQPNLDIITTANQDTPIQQGLEAPLLGLDVWEHAYYLDYKNKRDDYIKSWWNVVNWDFVSERFSN